MHWRIPVPAAVWGSYTWIIRGTVHILYFGDFPDETRTHLTRTESWPNASSSTPVNTAS